MMGFEGLNKKIREWLKNEGYLEETLPQKLAIPEILNGNDVLIIAPTGHGKTLAAVLPIFNKLLEGKKEGIRMLYITPLKSLNRDILDRIVKLANYIGLEVDLRHGDTSSRIRAQQRIDPADVLILTPETLQAIIVGKVFRKNLKSVKYVVVDEIHELCENKRGVQLSIGLERLERLIGHSFQRIGLSATIGNPKKISKFLTKKECKIIDARSEKLYDINVEYPKPNLNDYKLAKKIRTTPNIAYCLRRIYELVNSSKSTIIFVNTRETAEALSARFKTWVPEFPISVHHSSLSKDVRINVEKRFKSGKIKAIIATSSLELGIDIGSVDLVIHYGSPRQVTKILQRVGRSGHGVGRISRGKIICSSIDDYLEAIAIVRKAKEKWLEEPNIPEKPLDVLAHQIIGICMDKGIVSKEEIFSIVKGAYPYRNLTIKELEEVIELLKDIYLIKGKEKIFKTRRGLLYYFENLSTIPSEKNYFVIDSELNKKIGTLHQSFVEGFIKKDAEFIMKGEVWKVVEKCGNEIKVISTKNLEGAIPSWEGELIPVPFEIAKLAGDLREKFNFKDLNLQKKEFVLPTSKIMFVESYEDYIILHSCFGNKINHTLAKLLGAIISSKIGSSIFVRNDAYRIFFKIPEPFGKELIINSLNEISPEWIKSLIIKSIKNSTTFWYNFFQVAKRFGIIEKDVEFSQLIISKLIEIYQNTPVYNETVNEFLRNKLDIEKTKEILRLIKNGSIKIIGSNSYELSPLGAEGLNYTNVSLIRPKDTNQIYELVKQRILKKKFWFSCMNCGNDIGIFSVKSIPNDIKCPNCEARLIGFISVRNMSQAKSVLRKFFMKEKLEKEELKLVNNFIETAELFINYGKTAVFVLAGYGIGPRVGKRILSRYHRTEDDLIKDIINAERQFIENRMFWD